MRRRWSDRSSRRVRTLVTQLARSRLVRESGRMRADIHDGPEQTLQSEAGYSNARPRQPSRRNLLQRTAGPYSWVNRVDFGVSEPSLLSPQPRRDSGHRGTSRSGRFVAEVWCERRVGGKHVRAGMIAIIKAWKRGRLLPKEQAPMLQTLHGPFDPPPT